VVRDSSFAEASACVSDTAVEASGVQESSLLVCGRSWDMVGGGLVESCGGGGGGGGMSGFCSVGRAYVGGHWDGTGAVVAMEGLADQDRVCSKLL